MLLATNIEDVQAVTSFFRKVDYPAQPLHSATRRFLDDFFRHGGFETLCSRIFGPLDEYVADEEVCWMEQCDAAPASPLAAALSALVSPGCPFVTLLEAFSMPPGDAMGKLRSGAWKARGAIMDNTCTDYRVNLRLSALMTQSHKLLAEPDDTDLFALPRARYPAVLLVPFWQPPLVTGTAGDGKAGQVATSLPCTPLAYFVVRMLQYAMRRARQAMSNAANSSDASFVIDRPADSVMAWLRKLEQRALALISAPHAVDFPFHSRLVTAFVHHYVTPSLRLSATLSGERLGALWTTGDVTGMLLTLLPFTLSHRHVTQPPNEAMRTAITDMTVISQLLSMLPVMTELYICHNGKLDEATEDSYSVGPRSPTVAANDMRCKLNEDYRDDAKATIGNDMLCLTTTFYRYCLITLREVLLLLTSVPYCRAIHFSNALELWLSLMQPGWRRGSEPDEAYIVQHYEVYSCIVEDVWSMLQHSTLLARLDETGGMLLERCLQALHHPTARELASTLHEQTRSRRSGMSYDVTRYFVLNWRQGDGEDAVDIHATSMVDAAVDAYLAFEQRMRVAGQQRKHAATADHLQRCMSLMQRIVPSLMRRVEQRKTSHETTGVQHNIAHNAYTNNAQSVTHRNTACIVPRPLHRFYYKQRGEASWCMHNEVPMLVALTNVMDEVMEWLMMLYYDKSIPRCDAGHRMWLIEKAEGCACCRHDKEEALWQCALCGLAYGGCCRPLPRGCIHNEALHRVQQGEAESNKSMACVVCGTWLDVTQCAVYGNERKERYCASCASRPYRPWTTRWLASYTVLTVAFVVIVCLIVVRVLW